jgi:hypothetical protein
VLETLAKGDECNNVLSVMTVLCYSDVISRFGQISRSDPEKDLLNEVNQLVIQALAGGLVQLTLENYQSLVSFCQLNFSFDFLNISRCKCIAYVELCARLIYIGVFLTPESCHQVIGSDCSFNSLLRMLSLLMECTGECKIGCIGQNNYHEFLQVALKVNEKENYSDLLNFDLFCWKLLSFGLSQN